MAPVKACYLIKWISVSYSVIQSALSKNFRWQVSCRGSYNETEVSAPSWYIEWEHEIESLTRRSLRPSEINTTKSINLHRRRSTVQSVSSVNITQKYVTNKVPIISLKELNSLVKLNNFTTDEPLLTTIQPKQFQFLIQESNNSRVNLALHDQNMIRTNRLNAALILCKQKLLQWDRQNYQIFKRELGINIKRSSEIMPNTITLQTNYLKSNTEAGLWIRERF